MDTLSHGRDQPFYHCLAAPFASSLDSAHGCGLGSHSALTRHESQGSKRGLRIYAAQENLLPVSESSKDGAEAKSRRQAASAVMELLLGHGDALAAHFHSLDTEQFRFHRSELLEEMYPRDGPWGFERQLLQRRDLSTEVPLTSLASAASSGRGRLASLISL